MKNRQTNRKFLRNPNLNEITVKAVFKVQMIIMALMGGVIFCPRNNQTTPNKIDALD
jgi:hypothetical protein